MTGPPETTPLDPKVSRETSTMDVSIVTMVSPVSTSPPSPTLFLVSSTTGAFSTFRTVSEVRYSH